MEENNFENEAPAREEASLGFSAKGRIGRGLYCIAFVIYLVVYCIATVVVAQLDRIDIGVGVLVLLCRVVWVWLILQAIKRSHDIGHNGWWILILFYAFYLLFAKGEQKPNRYGNPV